MNYCDSKTSTLILKPSNIFYSYETENASASQRILILNIHILTNVKLFGLESFVI